MPAGRRRPRRRSRTRRKRRAGRGAAGVVGSVARAPKLARRVSVVAFICRDRIHGRHGSADSHQQEQDYLGVHKMS
jgi:hypothetical protein